MASLEIECTQISVGRFHHFHLARQLERFGFLRSIYTGYPRWKLTDESGIPASKIHTFPWFHVPYMARGKFGLGHSAWLSRELAWLSQDSIDHYVSRRLKHPHILIALSGSGLHSGIRIQALGGVYICDRAAAHIRVQEELLSDEYSRYGIKWTGLDPRIVDKEEAEYYQSDYVTVPSQFCVDSFVSRGFAREKILHISYGANLDRFSFLSPVSPQALTNQFRVLFVGNAGVQKGFIDLVSAFRLFTHPTKKLVLVGTISSEVSHLLDNIPVDQVELLGIVPNSTLAHHYQEASVLVLPSIQDGMGMVIAEAMACGCPVIASCNTGASELITNMEDGFIVPIRSPHHIADCLQLLADNPSLRKQMSVASVARLRSLSGWDRYGELWFNVLSSL